MLLIDAYRYLLRFLPHILLTLPVIYWSYGAIRTEIQWQKVLRILLPTGVVIALIFLFAGFPISTRYVWSAGRLAPAMAWVRGYHLYYPLGHGPVLVQMYGPVSAMVYVPVALMARPTPQIMMGSAINSLFYFLPGIWFLRCADERKNPIVLATTITLFILISCRQFVLHATATLVTIDSPAIGLATCAMAVLLKTSGERPWRNGVICGTFAALGAWTKWTVAPVVIAIAIYGLIIYGPRKGVRFVLGMGIIGVAISGMFICWFGTEILIQTLVIPARAPVQFLKVSRAMAAARASYWIWLAAMPVGLILIPAILIRPSLPRLNREGLRQFATENPWLLPLLAMLCVLPTSAMAYAKIGGIWNNAAASAYMALLAASSALNCASATGSTHPSAVLTPVNRLARVAFATILLAQCFISADDFYKLRESLALWNDLSGNEHEQAYQYVRQHPGEAFFPSYPLSMLLADGRLYHFNAGLDDLNWAGETPTDEQFNAWLPPNLKAILYVAKAPKPAMLDRMPQFGWQLAVPGMPEWTAMTRDGVLP